METNDIKNIWKSEVNDDIKFYSDSDLVEFIVKSAKNSMKRIQHIRFLRVLILGVMVYLAYILASERYNLNMKLLNSIVLSIPIFVYIYKEYKVHKMNKYKADMAIKNWLEYRIKDIEQEVKFTSRHGIFLYAGAFCIGFLIYFLNLYFSKTPINALSITVGIVILTLTVLISRFTYKRKYNKTLDELKELYQHLENNANE